MTIRAGCTWEQACGWADCSRCRRREEYKASKSPDYRPGSWHQLQLNERIVEPALGDALLLRTPDEATDSIYIITGLSTNASGTRFVATRRGNPPVRVEGLLYFQWDPDAMAWRPA